MKDELVKPKKRMRRNKVKFSRWTKGLLGRTFEIYGSLCRKFHVEGTLGLDTFDEDATYSQALSHAAKEMNTPPTPEDQKIHDLALKGIYPWW